MGGKFHSSINGPLCKPAAGLSRIKLIRQSGGDVACIRTDRELETQRERGEVTTCLTLPLIVHTYTYATLLSIPVVQLIEEVMY